MDTFTSDILQRLNLWREELPADTCQKSVPHIAHLHIYFALAVLQTLRSQGERSTDQQRNTILQDSKSTIISTIQSFKRERSLSLAPPTFLHQAAVIQDGALLVSNLVNEMKVFWASKNPAHGILRAEGTEYPPVEAASSSIGEPIVHTKSFNSHDPPASIHPPDLNLFLSKVSDKPNDQFSLVPNSADSEGFEEEMAMLDYLR